jgi:hypothetical protein
MTIEKLDAAVMGINNLPRNIAPGLDIVDGDSARFFLWPFPVTRRCQGCDGKDGDNHDNPAWQKFPRGPNRHKKVVHWKTISNKRMPAFWPAWNTANPALH